MTETICEETLTASGTDKPHSESCSVSGKATVSHDSLTADLQQDTKK